MYSRKITTFKQIFIYFIINFSLHHIIPSVGYFMQIIALDRPKTILHEN